MLTDIRRAILPLAALIGLAIGAVNPICAQGIAQLGTIFIEDRGNCLLPLGGGGFAVAGTAGPRAVLHKINCQGAALGKIEKTYAPGPGEFWDAVELPDGSIVAVGGATRQTTSGNVKQVILLKANPNMAEVASANFAVLGKEAIGKSIALSDDGALLVWGEVTGTGVDFYDAFFLRVDANTLQPIADPVIFSDGVDRATRIRRTADGNFLLSGSSFFGNIFNPDQLLDHYLRVRKVNSAGAVIWQRSVFSQSLAKYGEATACGAVESPATGNIILGGTLYGGTDLRKMDAFFAMISPDGQLLDTAYTANPGKDRMFGILAHADFPGLFSMVGDGEGSPLGVPSLVFAQTFELSSTELLGAAASADVNTPISARDIVEIDPGRVSFMALLPDNPLLLGATDIIITLPEVEVGIVYQNCALAATLSATGGGFQWLYEGQPIPNANQGVYFPTQPGLYQVQAIDTKGCVGISDTFRVHKAKADFSYTISGLSVTFNNLSDHATQYQWNFGDGSTSTLPNPVKTYASGGVYDVSLIARTPCGPNFADTIVQQVALTSAVADLDFQRSIRASPNPTQGTLRVDVPTGEADKLAFSLFNAYGQLIWAEQMGVQGSYVQKTFDLSQLPSGAYYLKVQSGQRMGTVKVLRN